MPPFEQLRLLCWRLPFAKVVQIQPFHYVRICGCYANSKVDHEAGQLIAIDQYDFLWNSFSELRCIFRKLQCGDEYTLAGAVADKASNKIAYSGTTYRVVPTLGLYVDNVETEPILLDDAVDAAIATKTSTTSRSKNEGGSFLTCASNRSLNSSRRDW